MNVYKDPNVKGRKFNGNPHLKIKMVKQSPRQKIRQLLRSFLPLEQIHSNQNLEKKSQ